MGKEPYCQHRYRSRGQPPSQAIEQRQRRTKFCHGAISPSFGLRSPLDQRAQTILRLWRDSDFTKTPYSKMHGLVEAAEKVARIRPQLSSERLCPFRRQAEVLSPMLKGTNFDKWLWSLAGIPSATFRKW